MEDRIVTPSVLDGEGENEYSLRPKKLNEYIGQENVKNQA